MTHAVSVSCVGTRMARGDEIVIGLYGPRGGFRAAEVVTLASARDLVRRLNDAINEIERAQCDAKYAKAIGGLT